MHLFALSGYLSSSPLRPDPRPINGILHAVFVLNRTCEGLERLSLYAKDEITQNAAQELRKDYSLKLAEGILTLEKDAEFTENGCALFKDIQAVAARLCNLAAGEC